MRLVIAAVAALAAGNSPGVVRAAPLEADAPHTGMMQPAEQSRAVVVLCEPAHLPVETRRHLTEAIGAELAELRVRVEPAPALLAGELESDVAVARALSREHGAAAVVWLAAAGRGWRLYLYEADRPQLRQRLIRGTRPASVAVEEVTVVLRSALTALLEEMESGMTEVLLPQEVTPTAPPDTSRGSERDVESTHARREAWLRGALGYAGALYAKEAPWQSGGFAALELRPGAGRAYLGLSHAWLAPFSVESDVDGAEVVTRIARRPSELFLGMEVFGETLRWGPEFGVMADYILRESVGAQEPLLATGRVGRWQTALSARIRASWLFGEGGVGWSGAGLSSSIGADFPLARFGHVAAGEEAAVVLLEQLPIRPRVDFGAFVSLW